MHTFSQFSGILVVDYDELLKMPKSMPQKLDKLINLVK